MTTSPEHDALRAAVLADPDDDLPRLVFADWLDESGDPDRARFVRSQVALAALPEWDPRAVALRRTQSDWNVSQSMHRDLPTLSADRGLHWVAQDLFRRGFGHYAQVPILQALQRELPRLLHAVPIQRLGLYGATLEQWKEFAASPWLPSIREIDFDGIGVPSEAMRELCASPGTTGIRALRFRSCVSHAMPVVLEQLWLSPLGRQLETLEMAQALAGDNFYFTEFLEAFHGGAERLRSLKLRSMRFGRIDLHRFFTSRSWKLEELIIADEGGPPGVDYFGYPDCWPELRTVRFDGVNVNFESPKRLADSLLAPHLTVLDLANSSLHPEAVRELCRADHLARLRIVRLRRMRIGNRSLRYLILSRFWKNLVELDLRGNPIDDNGAKQLLQRRPPPELELLRIDRTVSDDTAEALNSHYRGNVVFEEMAGSN